MLLFNKNLKESLKSKPLELRHNAVRINKKLDEKLISEINDFCGEALQSLSNIDTRILTTKFFVQQLHLKN